MKKTNQNNAIIGKFILDSLFIGMYNNPLMLFREYVQNSADAIDDLESSGRTENQFKIDILLDGKSRSIKISDNGIGVPTDKAYNTLHDLGRSFKKLSHNRGFRGIGRLGGLGYCDTLRFTTKAKNERIYTVSEWNCKKLRQLINESNSIVHAKEIIEEVAQFMQSEYRGSPEDHFFVVEMQNVRSSRDALLNVPMVKAYLSQIAPVPFNHKIFSRAKSIENRLLSHVPNYKSYNIYVNGEQIYKPYSDAVPIGKGITDQVQEIEFVEFKNGAEKLAFCWLAKLNLLGALNPSSRVDGIRIRSGNILIGDNYLLADYFRERRFNGYLVGEIHTVDHGLIPNSRRDDFEDNEHREEFYNLFIKCIGIPYSKKIRDASKLRTNHDKYSLHNKIIKNAKKIVDKGYLSTVQKKHIAAALRNLKNKTSLLNGEVENLIKEVNTSKHFLDLMNGKIKTAQKETLKNTFDVIYRRCSQKEEAEAIIRHIIKTVI